MKEKRRKLFKKIKEILISPFFWSVLGFVGCFLPYGVYIFEGEIRFISYLKFDGYGVIAAIGFFVAAVLAYFKINLAFLPGIPVFWLSVLDMNDIETRFVGSDVVFCSGLFLSLSGIGALKEHGLRGRR